MSDSSSPIVGNNIKASDTKPLPVRYRSTSTK
jgi:hypothetical protein